MDDDVVCGFKRPHCARLSYADETLPGCMLNGFKPPRPSGVYNRPGFGKKYGNGVVVGNPEELEVDGTDDLLACTSAFDRDLLEPVKN